MVLHFIEPEVCLINQNERVKNLMVIGIGMSRAYKYMDPRMRIELGPFACGVILGDVPVLFDAMSSYSVETITYSTVGIVPPQDV